MLSENEKIKYLTNSERIRLFTALETQVRIAHTPYAKKCAIRNAAFYKITYYCALRVTETTLIKVEDFNDLKGEIYCKRLKGGKNNTLQVIDSDILRTLKRHIRYNNPQNYLFENMKGNQHKQLSRKTIESHMKKIQHLTKIPSDKNHPHVLRHTRAIDLLENGLTIFELQYWLGHKDISNTQIYLDFTARQQEVLYKKLKRGR